MANEVNGNISGIRKTLLDEMGKLYELKLEPQQFASEELLDAMAGFTGNLGREISVYISRDGRVVDVSVGDSNRVSMPNMRLVRNEDRLSGVRCIHTHPGADGQLSSVDIGTLRSMRLDCMAALGVDAEGKPTTLYAGFLGEELEDGGREVALYGPMRPHKLPQQALMREVLLADARFKSSTKAVAEAAPQRAVLVGLDGGAGYDTLAELAELASTAGAKVVGRFLQRKRDIDKATYIGSGKAEELSLSASALEADIFIFDDELSAVQARNLENIIGTPVIDRTTLILDIFAQRAQSREGKLQVELAQLKYRLPRLAGQGTALSRLGGGIGTRGPGEKKLEVDRRRVRRRIFELEQELQQIEKQRGLRRVRREKNPVPVVALVGYTNAGKSTLLNALTDAGVLAENKLFATLDPVVRQTELPKGTVALFSDTVGFINKLPHDLVDAFHSTLEEVSRADLVLHIIDASSDYFDSQKRVVEEVLANLGAADTPRIDVYNKMDLLSDQHRSGGGGQAFISAKTGEGIPELLSHIEQLLSRGRVEVEILVPYPRYEAINLIRAEGRILEEQHEAEGTRVRALMDEPTLWKLKRMLHTEES